MDVCVVVVVELVLAVEVLVVEVDGAIEHAVKKRHVAKKKVNFFIFNLANNKLNYVLIFYHISEFL